MSDDQSQSEESETNNSKQNPSPSSNSEENFDEEEMEEEECKCHKCSDYSGYGYRGYRRYRLDHSDEWFDDEEEEEGDDLRCCVCQKQVKMMVNCELCNAIYCRRHATRNVQLTKEEYSLDKNDDLIFYACHLCLVPEEIKFGEWREGKVLTLEMLCAFDIARQMWLTNYPDKNSLSDRFAMANSLSVTNSVDKLYACSPLPIKKLIKRAVFLLGLELDFFHSRVECDCDTLTSIVVSDTHSFDESSEDNEENHGAVKRVKRWATCWERHRIEWTPQFTIRQLDIWGI